jgi:hypothetical protein
MVAKTKKEEALEERVATLERYLMHLGMSVEAVETLPTERADYIEFGSSQHAELLGLRKAAEDDRVQFDGFSLQDLTAFGPAARPEFIAEVLRQKVTSLKSGGPPAVQSADQRAPNYAPPMWQPV